MLDEIQKNLFEQAKAALASQIREFDSYADLVKRMEGEGGGGFANVYWWGIPHVKPKFARRPTRPAARFLGTRMLRRQMYSMRRATTEARISPKHISQFADA